MNVLSIAVNIVLSDGCRGVGTPDSSCPIVGNCVVADVTRYANSNLVVGEDIVLNC